MLIDRQRNALKDMQALKKEFDYAVERAWWAMDSKEFSSAHSLIMKIMEEVREAARFPVPITVESHDIHQALLSVHQEILSTLDRVHFNRFRKRFTPGRFILWDTCTVSGSGIIVDSDKPFILKVIRAGNYMQHISEDEYAFAIPVKEVLYPGKRLRLDRDGESDLGMVENVVPFQISLYFGDTLVMDLDKFLKKTPLIQHTRDYEYMCTVIDGRRR